LIAQAKFTCLSKEQQNYGFGGKYPGPMIVVFTAVVADPVENPAIFPAQFHGTCVFCHESVAPGDEIVWAKDDGTALHAGCDEWERDPKNDKWAEKVVPSSLARILFHDPEDHEQFEIGKDYILTFEEASE